MLCCQRFGFENIVTQWLLPPATKLGQGNIFRSVCQEFCPQGGACVVGGACMAGGVCGGGMHGRGSWDMHGRGMHSGEACMVGGHVWQGACMAGEHAWKGCVCGRGSMCGRGACVAGGVLGRYYEIRSMSGRYAFYWNACLFNLWLLKESKHDSHGFDNMEITLGSFLSRVKNYFPYQQCHII